jgi:NAD dependent epimerase/dehydratase
MNWGGKRVLVTGAGGFIGSHLVDKLVDLGADVTGLVHYNALGNWGWLDHSAYRAEIRVISGDICDHNLVRTIMKQAEIVFHLAALIAIPYSYQAPYSYVQTNIIGTLNVLHAGQELGTERLIHTSTSEVYGTAQYVPINEEHPLQGQSPYSATKISADKLAEAFGLSFGLPVVTIRPFNTFGPRQSARAVIPTIITQALSGSAVKLGSLHPTRDMNYVSNTVDGFIMAAQTPGVLGKTINLGSEREISIGGLASMIIRLIGKPVEVVCEQERMRPEDSEVERLLADAGKAHELLGWQPKVSLEDGLIKTINWIEKNIDQYRLDAYVI